MFRANDYRALIGQVEESNWTNDMVPVDTKHIREVSKEQAQWSGDKVMGEAAGSLGSRYRPGDYHIQDVGGELYWVAPLEFQGFFKWWNYKHTTGYILVSAEDGERKVELRTGYEMKYLNSACFSKNLHRHIFCKSYSNVRLRDFSFELDDDFKPWQVITVMEPTISFNGDVILGVIVVDPESGDMTFYKKDETPEWIDRIYPASLAESYFNYWGRYVKGWLNSWLWEENVMVPTPFNSGVDAGNIWFVKGSDGRRYWYTGMTSSQSTDQSLTGLALMDTRSGKTKYYRVSGSNEEAIVDVVNSAVSNYKDWHGTQPIPYNIWGELSYVVPVVNSQGIFQHLAIVRLRNSQVALGKSKKDVLESYLKLLSSGGGEVAPTSNMALTEMTLTVSSVRGVVLKGDTVFYLQFEEIPDVIFTVNPQVSPEVIFTSSGEIAVLKYIETGESIIGVSFFDNLNKALRVSETQSTFEEGREAIEEEIQHNESVEDAKKRLDNLSDEEILKLLDKK